ncbi:MAG: hypothetical protein IPG45_26825 [Deltaproteobacteria bacterium]|nr:hypothetical protein [Deltaproteobacteria bacterium]
MRSGIIGGLAAALMACTFSPSAVNRDGGGLELGVVDLGPVDFDGSAMDALGPDLGPDDLGGDVGLDGGVDAQPEDLGPDGGPDAGDLGVDAGPVCNPTCNDCQVCQPDGTCTRAPGGTICGAEFDCSTRVWGLDQGACHLYQGTVRGRCDSGARCRPANADSCLGRPQGVVIASCSVECLQADHPCEAGARASDVELSNLCELDRTTNTCSTTCTDAPFVSNETPRRCDPQGICVVAPEQSCGAYRCAGDRCGDDCDDAQDCLPNYSCDGDDECVP